MFFACLRAGTATVTSCRTVVALRTAPVCLVLCTFPLTGPSLDLDSVPFVEALAPDVTVFGTPGSFK